MTLKIKNIFLNSWKIIKRHYYNYYKKKKKKKKKKKINNNKLKKCKKLNFNVHFNIYRDKSKILLIFMLIQHLIYIYIYIIPY